MEGKYVKLYILDSMIHSVYGGEHSLEGNTEFEIRTYSV